MNVVVVVVLVAAVAVAVAAVVCARLMVAAERSRAQAVSAQGLAVLRADLETLRTAAERTQLENARLGATLRARLDDVGEKASSLGRQAEEFVAALRGGSKIQGNWGEGILTQVLEEAGLREGENFEVQTGSREAGLPDVTVFDGTSRCILIDSKVNIGEFIAASNAAKAGDAAEAERRMKAHAKSVRAQVASLAARDYPAKMRAADPAREYAPVVIMFLPSEATYAAAVSADPSLVAYANAQRVVLATPQMLFGYLVLFKMGLDRLQADRNNAEIVQRANQLLDRMDAAFAALDEVGKALEKAGAKYHDALRKLGMEPGGQNIVTPAKELQRLVNATTRRRASSLLQD